LAELSLSRKGPWGDWNLCLRCNCGRAKPLQGGRGMGSAARQSAPAKRLDKFCGAARLTAPVGLLLASSNHRRTRCVTAQEVGTFSRTVLSRRARRLCAS